MEILLLIAIAYAGARGLEKLAGVDARRASPEAEQVVKDAAGRKSKAPGPLDPGGTFAPAKAAPRTAALGGRAAGPIAVGVETGATMWAALREGYATAWPEARKQARLRMLERAERRRTERAAREAESAADKAVRAAEDVLGAAWRDAAAVLGARPELVDLTKPATTPTAEDETPVAEEVTPAAPAEDAGPTATVIPFRPASQGDPMSPNALIPEVRTLDGLMNALQLVNAMCAMRAEEAEVIAADDKTLSNRLDEIEAELADLDVDPGTRAEVLALRESIHAQSRAAAEYGGAAKDAADLAQATAQAAHKSHGGIAEAVQSSPIAQAANRGYYER